MSGASYSNTCRLLAGTLVESNTVVRLGPLGIVNVFMIHSFHNSTLQSLKVCLQLGCRRDGGERTIKVSCHCSGLEKVM